MMWLEIAILSPSISSSCDFSLGFVQNYIIFVFSIPLLLPLWPRPCEGHQDMQTNFSHSAGVPGKGVCPSEVHVNTTPPSLEVCYARRPCWLPPRLLPLILVLPTAMACGDSVSHFTATLCWCWKFRSLFTEITSPHDTPKAAGRPAQHLCQLPSQGKQIPGGISLETWGTEGDVSFEQSKNSLLTPPFGNATAAFGLDETNVLKEYLPDTHVGWSHWGPVSVFQLSFYFCLPAC